MIDDLLLKLSREREKEEEQLKLEEDARKREEEELKKRKAKLGKAANKKTDRELRAEAAERRFKAMQVQQLSRSCLFSYLASPISGPSSQVRAAGWDVGRWKQWRRS